MLGVAVSPTIAVAGVLLALTGAATITFLSTANSTLQLSSSTEMRGRVMSLYLLVFLGSTPIGGPIVGCLAEVLQSPCRFVVGGVGVARRCRLRRCRACCGPGAVRSSRSRPSRSREPAAA